MFDTLDLGLKDYLEALQIQEDQAKQIKAESLAAPDGPHRAGVLLFCKHPPVVTLGRKSSPEDVQGWQGQSYEIARGGKATYHGPSQLVLYPIINLADSRLPKQRDLGWYLRILEESIVETLEQLGIESEGRSLRDTSGAETGVWVNVEHLPEAVRLGHHNGWKKIASLGIGIRDWITFHGAAFNIHRDEKAFQGLRPCGFSPSVMVDLESLLGKTIDEGIIRNRWRENFLAALSNN